MSRLYDTVEPSVINDDMLQAAVEEQGPKEEASKIARHEGITFRDVSELRLDYRSLYCIFATCYFLASDEVKVNLDSGLLSQ